MLPVVKNDAKGKSVGYDIDATLQRIAKFQYLNVVTFLLVCADTLILLLK
jgi:hypothetical protein